MQAYKGGWIFFPTTCMMHTHNITKDISTSLLIKLYAYNASEDFSFKELLLSILRRKSTRYSTSPIEYRSIPSLLHGYYNTPHTVQVDT